MSSVNIGKILRNRYQDLLRQGVTPAAAFRATFPKIGASGAALLSRSWAGKAGFGVTYSPAGGHKVTTRVTYGGDTVMETTRKVSFLTRASRTVMSAAIGFGMGALAGYGAGRFGVAAFKKLVTFRIGGAVKQAAASYALASYGTKAAGWLSEKMTGKTAGSWTAGYGFYTGVGLYVGGLFKRASIASRPEARIQRGDFGISHKDLPRVRGYAPPGAWGR